MTVPVKAPDEHRLPSLTPALDQALRFALNKLDPPLGGAAKLDAAGRPTHAFAAADAPDDRTRSALAARAAELGHHLRPAGAEMALVEYRTLSTMAASADSAEELQREMKFFVEATADLPLFALREACDAFRFGKLGDGRWMPKAGEVRRAAERLLYPLAKERREIDAVLRAEIRPDANPTRRAANLAMARDLVASMRAEAEGPKRGGMTDAELREARALSEAIRTGTSDPRPMPKLSPEHRRALGPQPLEIDRETDLSGQAPLRPPELAAEIIRTLRRWRFRLDDEAALQEQIHAKLTLASLPSEREVRLGPADRIDMMVGAVGVEVKIKGQRRAIYRQCARYCGYERLQALVVVTNAAMGFPAEIEGKPIFVHELGKGWL